MSSIYTQIVALLCFNCRIFWTVAFILAVATAAYFITLLYHKWDDSPVIVSIAARSTQLISIPFPAVTICNMNKAKKSVAEEILQSEYV
jgi:amiloride-sensitive sodium channel